MLKLNYTKSKQVARSLYLLRKHKAAFEVRRGRKGRDTGKRKTGKFSTTKDCAMLHQTFGRSNRMFKKANKLQRRDVTFMQLWRIYPLQEDFEQGLLKCIRCF